jgi:hypothetical protein
VAAIVSQAASRLLARRRRRLRAAFTVFPSCADLEVCLLSVGIMKRSVLLLLLCIGNDGMGRAKGYIMWKRLYGGWTGPTSNLVNLLLNMLTAHPS